MMLKQTLSNMQKVELRDVWPHEAADFTKWLAEPENLSLLGEAIDIELECLETESSVGAFHADILAAETGTNRKVIIENQLGETNHDHLGKVITYAAGKGGEVVVWIVAHARDEHRKAIEWLNQHTDKAFGFFLVEIELWRIDGSNPAPRFNIVERPNDWAKSFKELDSLNETQKLQLQYWEKYREIALSSPEVSKYLRPHKAQPQNWTNLYIGSSNYHLELTISVSDNRISAVVYVPDNKEIGAKIIENKALFEEALGVDAVVFDKTKASGLRFHKRNCNVRDHQEKWPEFIDWQLKAALKLREIVLSLDL